MAASYTQEQRAEAKAKGQHLVTISAGSGFEFSGPVTTSERNLIAQFLLDFQRERQTTEAEAK